MNDSDYIIVGDTERFEGCLICVAGKTKGKCRGNAESYADQSNRE